jgi:hypothetical protein
MEFVTRCFQAARTGGTSSGAVEELIAELGSSGVIEDARERGAALVRGAVASIRGNAFPERVADESARSLLSGLAEMIG